MFSLTWALKYFEPLSGYEETTCLALSGAEQAPYNKMSFLNTEGETISTWGHVLS